jgi:hypothetical protein
MEQISHHVKRTPEEVREESPEGMFYRDGVLLTKSELEAILTDEGTFVEMMVCSECGGTFTPGEYRHGGKNEHWTVTA